MKVYHWIFFGLLIFIGIVIWVAITTPVMKINGVGVHNGYETLRSDLIAQGCELYDENSPIIPIEGYKFYLHEMQMPIVIRSIDSLSLADFNKIVTHYTNEYNTTPLIEGRDKFMRLESKGSDQLFDYNSNTHAFYKIIAQATDYGEGALFEIDKYNYIFVGYTSNWNTYHVHVLYYVL